MRLQVVTPKSNKSSGSVLRIDLNDVAGNTKVTISGWPGAQLFDFGESKRLVEKVASGLVEKSPSKRPSS